jgi:hypothetical protein
MTGPTQRIVTGLDTVLDLLPDHDTAAHQASD